MLGVALAMIVIGVVILFLIPWVGIPIGILGVILLVVYLVGAVRRPAERP
jgi:hypothetical protein